MGFQQITATPGARNGKALSADNSGDQPPAKHLVMDVLRHAAPLLGLKPPVLATLDAMLSCLPPKRSHNTVFASNDTLVHRRDGISERTIRRHVLQLVDAGLLMRQDSANRKRYVRRSAALGACIRFGFDLSPLFQRYEELVSLAAEAIARRERIGLLKAQLRAAMSQRLQVDPEDPTALDIRRALRRTLSEEECRALLATVESPVAICTDDNAGCDAEPTEMTGRDGQNVRHHHNSNKELNDKKAAAVAPPMPSKVVTTCPEALSFCDGSITTEQDIVRNSRILAPMVGISPRLYAEAEDRNGRVPTAIAVFAMIELQSVIRSIPAYFRTLTGSKVGKGLDVNRLLAYVETYRRQRATGRLSADKTGFEMPC